MKRFLAMVLAALTLLTATGCASFLNRSYTEVFPHSASYYEKTDKSVLRAEGYLQSGRDHNGYYETDQFHR